MNEDVRWLTSAEQTTWRRLISLHMELFPLLDRDLKDMTGFCLDDYSVIVLLSETPGHRLRMSVLADKLHMQPSRLTYRVGQLEHMGCVERVRSTSDGRSVYATLTPEGIRRLEEVAPVHVQSVRRRLLDHYDPEEFEELGLLLERVTADSARVSAAAP